MSFRASRVIQSGVASALLLVGAVLQAQDITKGSIAGVVRDPSGSIIAGAKMDLASPFGSRSTTSNNSGEYSFLNLGVGSGYRVVATQPGFSQTTIDNLTVGVNQRTTADVTLQIGAASQIVEVSASGASAIDLNTATIGANIDTTLYTNVPVGRNIASLLSISPGVSDSGGAGNANPSINGASGLENQYIINGANVTDPAYGGFGTYSRVFGPLGNGVNFDFIQEVQVKTGGFEAQYGQALGGVVNILTKSGSNRYQGSVYGYFSPTQFEATRPDLNAVNSTKVDYPNNLSGVGNYDFGADLGGFIMKDKLFWYGGINPQFNHTIIRAAAGFGNTLLGDVDNGATVVNYLGKLSYNLTPSHQFEGSVFGDPSHTPTSYFRGLNSNLGSTTIDTLTKSKLEYGSRTWTGRYNGAFSPKWVVIANFSDYHNSFTETPLFDGYRIRDNTPVQENPDASAFSYNGLGFLENSEANVHQFNATSSHVLSWLGSHTFEYGYQFEDINYNDVRVNTGGDFQIPDLPEFGDAAGATQHGAALTRTHRVGADPSSPIVLRVTRGDYSSPNVQVLTRYHSGFVQDSWTLGNRLTVKPGIRFEQQAMSGNALRYVFSHNWAPRIGVIYDPTGHRRTKFFANWGRFYEKVPLDISIRAFSFETSVIGALYKDPGPGAAPDLSAANYIPGGSISFQGGPGNLTLVAPGTRAQYQDEVIGGYEQEFNGGYTFSGRFVYRHIRRIIEDVSGINVTQANAGVPQQYVVSNPSAKLDIFQNASPCTSGPNCDTGTGYTSFANGNPLGSDGIVDGFPNATRIYKSMELIFSKRLSSHAQVYANYVLSKLYGNFQGSFRSDNGQTDPNISSLFDFTNSDGLLTDQVRAGVLPTDRTHQFKLFGSYELRHLNLGLSWNIQSGSPISQLADHPVYQNAGEVPVGGRGALGRTDAEFPLDLHADYSIPLGESKRLKFVADLFNVANQTRALRINQSSELDGSPGSPNSDFLHPALYENPFRARLAIRFEF